MSKPNAFLFKRHNPEHTNHVDDCVKNDCMTLGWPKVKIPADDYGKQYPIREIVEREYAELYKPEGGKMNRYATGTVARHFRYFLGEMKVGDYVVTNKHGEIFIGEVTGEPQYKGDDAKDISYTRSVTWSNDKKGYSTEVCSALLAGRLKVRSASARMGDCVDELKSLVEKGEQPLKARLYEKLTEPLVQVIGGDKGLAVFGDRGLEELVFAYFRAACGASGEVIPRKIDKGIDVVITIPVDNIEQVTASMLHSLLDQAQYSQDDKEPLRIGIQVKQHQGATQSTAKIVEKLKNAMGDSSEPIHFGLVVTTAKGFDDESKELWGDIESWNGEKFALAILETGLGRVFEEYEKKH